MKIVFKIILIIIILYFVGGIIFWIYHSFSESGVGNRISADEKARYEHEKLCYECFTGIKSGVCPLIDSTISLKKEYPNAKAQRVEVPPGGFKSSFENRSCYWYEDLDKGFNLEPPKNNLSHYLKIFAASWQLYFLFTIAFFGADISF